MKVTAGTIARTVILALALVNQVLTSTGHAVIPIEDDQITEIITLTITIASSLVAWWKNSSFTREAIVADQVMKSLKAGELQEEDVANLYQ